MYAIVDIAGQQFKVEKDKKIFVHRLESEAGSQVDFDKVLLIDNEKSVAVGAPFIDGAMVTVKVLEHLKGDKVIVFKKKRRKGYKVKNGHRQFFTQVLVEEIVEKGGKPRPVIQAKQSPKPAAKTKDRETVSEPVLTQTVSETAVTPTVEKQAAVKKPAAKQTETKKAVTEKAPVAEKVKKAASKEKAATKPKAVTKKADETATVKKETKPAKAKAPVKKEAKAPAAKTPAKKESKQASAKAPAKKTTGKEKK